MTQPAFAAVSTEAISPGNSAQALLDGFEPAIAVSLAVALLGAAAIALRRRSEPMPCPEVA